MEINTSRPYFSYDDGDPSFFGGGGNGTSVGALLADAMTTPPPPPFETLSLNVPYVACEALVAVVAVAGNAMVILAFHHERRLRRRTNYYIVSLAVADLLVGMLGIPFAVLASMGLPHNLYACLFTVSLLIVLCTISIFCLVAVSVDRYWAILYPLGYSRNVSTKKAIGIIGICWTAGSLVGFLPLFGWHRPSPEEGPKCFFTEVMDYNYLVFLYFFTIVFPALILAAFYAHIYQVVLKQLRRMERQSPGGGIRGGPGHGHAPGGGGGGGTMLRMLGAARKREVKATQNLSIIVLFFVLCWFPLYTINCVQAFCPRCFVPPALMDFCIILSHLNSAGNPLLYAYHLKDFRAAFRGLLLGTDSGDNGLDFTGATGVSTGTALGGGCGGGGLRGLQRSPIPLLAAPEAVGAAKPRVRASLPPLPPLPPLATITTALGDVDDKLSRCQDSLWSLHPSAYLHERSDDSDEEEARMAGCKQCGRMACGAHEELLASGRGSGSLPRIVEQPTSPRTRLSPLRVVGDFFFSSSCSWREDTNGKVSSTSTEPLDTV